MAVKHMPPSRTHTMTPRRAIFLTGFMGAGKTSVGAALARRRGCAFHDLDAYIVERAGMSVAQIFETQGEAGFRRLEAEVLAELIARIAHDKPVVALGGGTLLAPQNLRAVREAGGVLVTLTAPLHVLYRRTQAARGTRPLAQDEAAFRQLHEAREPHYHAADVMIDSSLGDVEAVAAQVEHSVAALMGERREKR
jgi:shikimate kinase